MTPSERDLLQPDQRYAKALADRQSYVDAIVGSLARRKIVVAGPGTGKTYLFKQVLRDKPKTLTLTFVNSLIEQLALELCGMSDVRTLHSFARSELRRANGKPITIFPKLPRVIEEDAEILLGRSVKFEKMFYDRDDGNPDLAFYQERKGYYGEWRGYSDVVFDLVTMYEKEASRVPEYDQVVIDEFQDFNMLEVSLIDSLAEKSPILLAGDDDQALYDFKSASACHIRSKHGNECPDYASFELPYCSRSTRVIVDAVNDVVGAATEHGLLRGRVNKSYMYFECQAKDEESAENPKLVYLHAYAKQIPWAIEKRIKEIAKTLKSEFSVLVISQTRRQSDAIASALVTKGFNNVRHVVGDKDSDPSLVDGLKLIMEERTSNLGWRIAAGCLLGEHELAALVEATNQPGAQPVMELIAADKRKQIAELVKVCRKIEDGKSVKADEVETVLDACGCSPQEVLMNHVGETLSAADGTRGGEPGVRGIPITATTVQGSKGLAADYVFITHCDDQYIVKDKDKSKIADRDVCNFLVALTRARKRAYLISSNQAKEPQFVQWIADGRVNRA
jgi:superfamily I DNA/RNA helicase